MEEKHLTAEPARIGASVNPGSLQRVRRAIQYRNGQVQESEVLVVHERPLTVFLNGAEFATIICSPEAYEELVLGFLYSEGLIRNRQDVFSIKTDADVGLIWLETVEMPRTDNFLRRNLASCCGRGRAGLYFINDARQLRDVETPGIFEARLLLDMMASLDEEAAVFKASGGTHSAALGGPEGIICRYEDIGRHNAVDKVIGCMLIHNLEPDQKCLVLSGRIASEILIKAARAGIPLIISRAAPTNLTLELADDFGITVVGFARSQNFNVYTHPEKIAGLI